MERSTLYPQVCLLLQEAGYEGEFRAGYSGRGMYGSTCPAIVTDASAAIVGYLVATVVIAATDGEVELEEHLDLIPRRWDNMGLSMVYY